MSRYSTTGNQRRKARQARRDKRNPRLKTEQRRRGQDDQWDPETDWEYRPGETPPEARS